MEILEKNVCVEHQFEGYRVGYRVGKRECLIKITNVHMKRRTFYVNARQRFFAEFP